MKSYDITLSNSSRQTKIYSEAFIEIFFCIKRGFILFKYPFNEFSPNLSMNKRPLINLMFSISHCRAVKHINYI